MLLNCFAVGAGGFIGAVLRYLIGLIPVLSRGVLPYQTLLVNAAGAVLIGMIAQAALVFISMPPNFLLFMKTGVCGGFTTFSTFSLESVTLIENHQIRTAVLYIALSILCCVVGVLLGKWIGMKVFS